MEEISGYPRLVFMQVYTVNDKPLFYGYPQEPQVYCLPDKQWIDRPSYLDHFSCRELEPCDMPDVVLHDLVEPQDFAELKSRGLIEPQLDALYTKIQELKAHLSSVKPIEDIGMGQDTTPAIEAAITAVSQEGEAGVSDNVAKVLQAIHASMANPGLVGEIRKCVEGLTEQEKDYIKLVSKYFGLAEANV